MAQQDLTTVDGVLNYLEQTAFASSRVEQLTGGGGNYTFRIHLRQPHRGRTTAVVKHAKPYIPGMRTVPFALYRQVRRYVGRTMTTSRINQSEIRRVCDATSEETVARRLTRHYA